MRFKITSATQFKLYLLGDALMFSGVYGIFTLISSIHIEDGIGSTSLAISYSTSFFTSLIVPLLAKKFGARSLFLVGTLCYLLFVAGNAYTTHITMILAGIFYSFGNCLVWPMASLFNVHFAKMQSQENRSNTFADIRKRYFGYYYSVFSISEVVGNAVMYGILSADRNMLSNTDDMGNVTLSGVDKSYCGANDCQLEHITESNKQQYAPVNVSTQYVVTGTCCSFVLAAFIIFYIAVPTGVGKTKRKSTNDQAINPFIEKSDDEGEQNNNVVLQLLNSLSELFLMIVSYKHFIIILLSIYTGLTFAFVHTEMSRAFASCILGLNHVSLCFVVFASMFLFSSSIFSRIAGRFGRNIPFTIAYVSDMFLFMFCLYAEPANMKHLTVYALFLGFGFTQGIWMPLINELYTDYFKDQKETAVAVYQLMFSLGNLLVFAFSTALCVHVKMYVLIFVLSSGLLIYTAGSFLFFRFSSRTDPEETKTVVDENQNITVIGKQEAYDPVPMQDLQPR